MSADNVKNFERLLISLTWEVTPSVGSYRPRYLRPSLNDHLTFISVDGRPLAIFKSDFRVASALKLIAALVNSPVEGLSMPTAREVLGLRPFVGMRGKLASVNRVLARLGFPDRAEVFCTRTQYHPRPARTASYFWMPGPRAPEALRALIRDPVRLNPLALTSSPT